MKIKFWGVRGSIPCPGPHTVKYGGNTSCIELRLSEPERLIIIDAGSGIRELGNQLMARDLAQGPIRAEIFLSHTHWDHIMGFPFFVPSYLATTKLKVHGPFNFEGESLEEAMAGQMTYRYFPIRKEWLAAEISYVELKEGLIDLKGGVSLRTKYLNHPVMCLGYRFEYNGKVVCTAYDTEPYCNLFAAGPDDPSHDEHMAAEGELVAREQNRALEDFFTGADLLIYDAQYTRAEYETSKKGWGHSSFEHACETASRARVKSLVLFHHDPMRTDSQLDQLAEIHCAPGRYGNIKIRLAREGLELEI